MMIGDENLDAALHEGGDDLAVARAAIDGQHELETRFETAVHHAPREPVSVLRAIGHEEMNVRAELGEHLEQKRRAADAVGVVVPVHEDAFAARDRLVQQDRRAFHFVEEKRIVKLLEFRMDESKTVLDAPDASRREKPRLERSEKQRPGQLALEAFVSRLDFPDLHRGPCLS